MMKHNLSLATILSLCLFGSLGAESALEKVLTDAVENVQAITAEESTPKKGGAYLLEKKFGGESVTLEFPAKPKTKKKDGIYTATLQTNKSEYLFLSPEPPEEGINSLGLFAYILDELSSSYEILDSDTRAEDGYDLLTGHSLDKKGKKEQKFKVYVTPNNFYIISVEYPNGKEDSSHAAFLGSFRVNE